ncbi:MAG: phage holin family protein [Aeromicrobium erythreum]
MSGADRTPVDEASTGRLLAQATEDVATLVRSELELAKTDLAESGKRLGVGVGAFGGAGVLALYGLGLLLAAAVLGLAQAVDAWLAALIVAAAVLAVAGVAALVGKQRVSTVGEPPAERKASVQADVDAVRPGGHA